MSFFDNLLTNASVLIIGGGTVLIKSDSVLISTVPPPVINTDALVDRLSKNDITFIFDHPDEMPKEELARIAKQEIFISNMTDFIEGKNLKNKVN